jgi:DNA-binding MarR family transcriptional regulator
LFQVTYDIQRIKQKKINALMPNRIIKARTLLISKFRLTASSGSIRQLIRAVYIDSVKISSKFGLTAPQSAALRCLANNGRISSAQLSRELYTTPSNITGIVDRLEAKGLVQRIRQPEDRRVYLIGLTETGRALGNKLPQPIEVRLASALAKGGIGRISELRKSFEMLIQMIEAQHLDETPLC